MRSHVGGADVLVGGDRLVRERREDFHGLPALALAFSVQVATEGGAPHDR